MLAWVVLSRISNYCAAKPIEKAENAKVLAAARALPYEELRKRDLPDAFDPRGKDIGKRR